MVPTLPGSCTASSTSSVVPEAVDVLQLQRLGSITATTPCGCSVSASVSSSAVAHALPAGRRAPVERALERLSRG